MYVLQSCWSDLAYARWCFINSPTVLADRYIIRSLFSFFLSFDKLYAYLTMKYFKVICHSTVAAVFCCNNSAIYYSPWKPGELAFLLSFAGSNVEIVSIIVLSVLLVTPCSTVKLGSHLLLGWWNVSRQRQKLHLSQSRRTRQFLVSLTTLDNCLTFSVLPQKMDRWRKDTFSLFSKCFFLCFLPSYCSFFLRLYFFLK